MTTQQIPDCCKSNEKKKESTGLMSGVIYGLVPHIGCIAFLLFAVLGVTAATALFKPLLMSSYFFYGLIALSIVFATISALIYLKKHELLSISGAKQKWKYLAVLYGTTIAINLLMFLVIFPLAANAIVSKDLETACSIDSSVSQCSVDSKTTSQLNTAAFRINVDIPCSGHAPLIIQEVKTLDGVTNIKYIPLKTFEITYDKNRLSKEEILDLEIFKTFKAQIVG